MSWIPGWSSIAGAAWWSGFYFWASIVALIGLGIAEIASHRYSDRKDELAEIEQRAVQRRHDEDMARVQHDTVQATERAARLEKEAAETSKEAAQLRLALKERENRTLTEAQKAAIIERLKPLPNKGKIIFNPLMTDGEAIQFSDQIKSTLQAAGYEVADVAPKDRLLSVNRTGAFLWFKDVNNAPDDARHIATAFRLVGITILGEPQPDFPDPTTLMIVVASHP